MEQLVDLVRSARAGHPELALPDDVFMAFLAAKIAERPELAGMTAEQACDLYLACAAGNGQAAAITLLERQCFATLPPILERMGLARDDIAEVQQIVRQLLLVPRPRAGPAILNFSGSGDLCSWVRVIATREAVRLVRRRREAPAEDDRLFERVGAPTRTPEALVSEARYRSELKAAFSTALGALTKRERALLRQHYVDELTLDQIAIIYRVHRATVARWLAKARSALVARTVKALGSQLQLARSELDSILRQVRTNLDLSLPRVLV